MMKYMKLLLLSLVILITACTQPLPSDKQHYAGYWEGGNSQFDVKLLIRSDGYVIFERKQVSQRHSVVHPTRVTGPILQFTGNDFRAGANEPGIAFRIAQPPQEVDGTWRMNLDGFLLTKQPQSSMSEAFLHGETSHSSDEFDGLNGDH